MTAAEVKIALATKHSPPEWASFSELRDGTGWSALRSYDFWTIRCWGGSGGSTAIAYEVKVSRGDFLKELQQPDKRKSAECYSHECYFAAPAGLIKPEEVPIGWGLLEVLASGATRRKVIAQQRDVQFDTPFVCTIARRSAEIAAGERKILLKFGGDEITEESLEAIIENRLSERVGLMKDAIRREVRDEVNQAFANTDEGRQLKIIQEYTEKLAGRPVHSHWNLSCALEALDKIGWMPSELHHMIGDLRKCADRMESFAKESVESVLGT